MERENFKFLDLEWWQICFVAVMVFLAFLFTNYLIKKINEARIEERYARLAQREAVNQGTQYQELGLKSGQAKENVPTEENKPSMNRPRKQIFLSFDKDENIHHGYRTQEAMFSKANNTEGLEDIKVVAEKTADTLPCTVNIKPEKHTSISTNTEVEEKNNAISNASNHTFANIVNVPISEILQKTEATTSTEGLRKHFEEKVIQTSVLSCHNDVGIQMTISSNHNLQILDKPAKSAHLFEKDISLKYNDVITQPIEANKENLQLPEISQGTDEFLSRKDSDASSKREKTENKITRTASTQSPEPSQETNISLLSKEILPQVSIKNTKFLISEISQAAVETLSQKTSNSSLIKSLSSVKATNTPDSTPADDSKNDGNHPSTTIGLVMLDVTQKVGYSLFHNTNDFTNENEQEVTNIAIDNSVAKETGKAFSLKSSNIDIKCSKTKNGALAKVVKITSTDADPQTSKMKKKTRKTLTHTLGDTSKTNYTRNLKSFWDIFLSHRRS